MPGPAHLHLRISASPHRRTAGFTLIELLIVMVIITVLASIGLLTYSNSVTRAKEAALMENLDGFRRAIDAYYADKQKYPATLEDLVTEKYIRKVPPDITGSTDTWQTEMSEPDPGNPTAESGISDVHSGSEQTSPFEGTRYSDW